MDYELIEKSKLYSIEKRSRTLKYLLDSIGLKWYSNEGFNSEDIFCRKTRTLINKWNLEIGKTGNNSGNHVELGITRLRKNIYSAWVQRSENGKLYLTRPIIFRGDEVMQILPIFARVGVFNELNEWIWL